MDNGMKTSGKVLVYQQIQSKQTNKQTATCDAGFLWDHQVCISH